VIRMARAGLLGFFGAGGLPLVEVERAVASIQQAIGVDVPYGVNLLASLDRPDLEQDLVDLCLRRGVRFIEAAAFTQLTAPLVEFRFRGAGIENGRAHATNQILAKVSRAEVAKAFLSPPSEEMLRRLCDSGRLSAMEASAARRLPVSADVCVEADSGGHTDAGVALALLPSMARLRDQLTAAQPLDEIPRIGAAGGLGSPEAIAAAFVLGAEFVVAGSINQCTPQAGTSSAVKDLLAEIELHDTTYAPAGDMFELGAKVQVVKRSTLFAARANQLYQIYRTHESLDELPAQTVANVERFLGRPLDEVWQLSRERLAGRPELARAERSPKARMAQVFKWYFRRSIESALAGDISDRVNFQIHCGPAMGAFNAFLRGGALEPWSERHVDVIAGELMARADHRLSGRK
jgi:trans-AT polyketide synthase/acyltransferase/oxidoreductase domain-containing protein